MPDDLAFSACFIMQCTTDSRAASLALHGFLVSGEHRLHEAICVLQAVFNDVKGDECVFLWRAIGAALVSLVSVTSYSLRVGLSWSSCWLCLRTMFGCTHYGRRFGTRLRWVWVKAETV